MRRGAAGWLLATAFATACTAAGAAAARAAAPSTTAHSGAGVPAFEAVRASHAPSDIPLLARDGTPLQSVRIDDTVRRGPWVALADVSPALRTAIVLSEDRRFWDHGGVDWRALAAGAWAQAWDQRTRGASTLTMQLAGLTDATLARPPGGRAPVAKMAQIVRARGLEAGWSKSQILEAYLNRVPLRGELVGVAAAAQLLFGKHAGGLDAVEAALLAAMVRAPNAPVALVERRACAVLRLQALGCEGVSITLSQALARRPASMPAGAGDAPAAHLARLLARGAAPGTAALASTLDARLQRAALGALRRQLAELRGRNVEDGALVVLDNASGEVLAWVGSAGSASAAPAVDAVLARRQPGSTVKPLVYAAALQRRLITAASVLDDAPIELGTGSPAGDLYAPQNYDRGWQGAVTARVALASSLNVPAVRVAALLGPDAVFDTLVRAGLRPSESAGYHGHALALGSADATLLDLANAYRMLANGGSIGPVVWQRGARGTAGASDETGPGAAGGPRTAAVFDPAVAWVVAGILADAAARAPTFGIDSPLVTRGWAAVKTGTSKDMRDNWCIGFSVRYTVAVWVGNAGGAPMHAVSGTTGAAPVWREVMGLLHADEPARPPSPPPPGLVSQRGEWFLRGTEPGALATGAAAPFGIESPRPGSVVALDPDIPIQHQRMVFRGAPGIWTLDGRVLGSGATVSWLPRPGRHVLQRRGADGTTGATQDRVEFDVRAAPPSRRGVATPPKKG